MARAGLWGSCLFIDTLHQSHPLMQLSLIFKHLHIWFCLKNMIYIFVHIYPLRNSWAMCIRSISNQKVHIPVYKLGALHCTQWQACPKIFLCFSYLGPDYKYSWSIILYDLRQFCFNIIPMMNRIKHTQTLSTWSLHMCDHCPCYWTYSVYIIQCIRYNIHTPFI